MHNKEFDIETQVRNALKEIYPFWARAWQVNNYLASNGKSFQTSDVEGALKQLVSSGEVCTCSEEEKYVLADDKHIAVFWDLTNVHRGFQDLVQEMERLREKQYQIDLSAYTNNRSFIDTHLSPSQRQCVQVVKENHDARMNYEISKIVHFEEPDLVLVVSRSKVISKFTEECMRCNPEMKITLQESYETREFAELLEDL